MIGRLSGRVLRCTPSELLLDVGGVGYQVQIPLSTFYALTNSGDAPVSVHVHTHVREDSLQLFGFASEDERAAFDRLLAVSGIGPRLALVLLSGIGPAELETAVEAEDRARLERIPGIGRKTAERILFELRSRASSGRTGVAAVSKAVRAGPPGGTVRGDAVSALENLGYPRERAWSAVQEVTVSASGESESLESVLRSALQRLLR